MNDITCSTDCCEKKATTAFVIGVRYPFSNNKHKVHYDEHFTCNDHTSNHLLFSRIVMTIEDYLVWKVHNE